MMKGPVERFQSTNRIFPGFTYIKAINTLQRKGQNRDWRELIFLENCIEVRIYDHLNFFTTFLYPKNGKVPKFIST